MDPLWTPPEGHDPKLGRLDRLSCGESLADHGGARIRSDWLPFAHGIRKPLPEPGLQPPPDANGFPWQTEALQQVGRWRLSAMVGCYSYRHSSRVTSVGFSPDGRIAISGSGDRTARLWDVSTGREIRALVGHDLLVTSVAICPYGSHALTGSRDDTARLWHLASGRELQVFEGHSGSVLLVAFSPDGRYALTGSDDGTARLWDPRTGEAITVLAGHTYDPVYSVAFAPDGRLALTGSADGTIHLWNLASGAEVRAFVGDPVSVESVAFSPDGRFWVRGLGDGRVRMSEVASGRELHCFADGSSGVTAVAVSPRGHLLASGSRGTVRVRRSSGEDVAAFTDLDASVVCLSFSPDDRLLMAGLVNGDIHLWDLETGSDARPPRRLAGPVRDVALTPRSALVLASAQGDWYRDDRLWAVPVDPDNDDDAIESVPVPVSDASTLAVSPDARHVLVGGDGAARLWNLQSGTPGPLLPDHDGEVTMTAMGDGLALTGTSDGDVVRWRIRDDTVLHSARLAHLDHEITAGALSPDGRHWVAAGGRELWAGRTDTAGDDIVETSVVPDRYEFEAPVTAVAWSDDGRSVAVATSHRDVFEFPVATGEAPTLTDESCQWLGRTRRRVVGLCRFRADSGTNSEDGPPRDASDGAGTEPVWLALTSLGCEPIGAADTVGDDADDPGGWPHRFRPLLESVQDEIVAGVISASGSSGTIAVGTQRKVILIYKWG